MSSVHGSEDQGCYSHKEVCDMAQLKKHMHATETTLGEQKVFIPKDLTDKATEI